ncbi:MAG: helix-turn-helix transcriptional regulator [Lachnospiraceae bacterium]|nr:helix-turn-helix transcriptional regulator [Lachnospiraceae bacterium]
MIISERIFELLDEREITQQDFAKATGISQSTISDWKRKKTNPSSDKILKICEVLGVSPNELLQNNKEELDYIFVSKGTEKYELVMGYEKLNRRSKDRLLGYLDALKEIKSSKE